uniref:F-box/kelch-repeat protein At3g24760-like n=1 Tax=Nicotiana tabacum TaxID=4097 RepID=A0A1S3X1P4_TOBAC|nr:PREDICTED: F-box/kelch-repeat protein At3g24760-like [Nicotiana tabacum]
MAFSLFKPILNGTWVQTSPLKFSRCNPLVGVYYKDGLNQEPRFIVVGGVRFVGGLVEIEDRFAVEIYNPNLDFWELCPRLPADFRSGGLCNLPNGPNFILWKVDEKTMEFSEIAIMPQELMYCLFDSEEDDKFASLKCVGLGNIIYVYNEEHHKNYPACVCEFGNEFGKCSWRKVPNLSAIATC